MSNEVNAALWGLLGTLVGAAASVGTTWIANAHVAKLETQKSKDQRAETARAFLRQTLIELQDAVHHLVRQSTNSHLHDVREFRAGNKWGVKPPADELSEAVRTAFRTVAILNQRVASDDLRNKVTKFTGDVAESINAGSLEDATTLREYMLADFNNLSQSIGEVLRKQYEHT